MMEKNDEVLEDGLQSKSLEEIDSCSSSILDSEEEEDGINVTIKAVAPGVTADEPGDLASQKLAGSERRRMKKKIVEGMEVEEARATVISSTPKRSRNTALNSPTGGTDLNPDPKKVCATGSAATKKGGASGSIVSEQQGGDVEMNEVSGDVKCADSANGDDAKEKVGGEGAGGGPGPSVSAGGVGKPDKKKKKNKKKKSGDSKKEESAGAAAGCVGSGVSSGAGATNSGTGTAAVAAAGGVDAGAGIGAGGKVAKAGLGVQSGSTSSDTRGGKIEKKKGGETVGGSASKKIRKETLPAPTYQQIASRIKIGVIPAGYPDVELTPEQQDVVKEELLKKVLEQRREQFKPKFVYCKATAGFVMLLCQEKDTAAWVKSTASTITPWENAQLSALEEAHIPRKDVLRAFFYRSKKDENDTILAYLESQNDNLDTSAWRVLRRSVVNDHVDWAFTVDSASMQLLEERQFVVNFKFGQTMFRKKRTDNGSHPTGDDSEEEMEVDNFDEGLLSEEQNAGGEMTLESGLSAPSGNDASDGKLNNQNNNPTGEHIILNPRALTAQGSTGGSPSETNNKKLDLSGKDCTTNPRALNAQGSENGSSRLEIKSQSIEGDHQPEHEGGKVQQ